MLQLKFGYIDLELDQRSTDGIIWKDLSEGPYMYIQNINALHLQKRYDQRYKFTKFVLEEG